MCVIDSIAEYIQGNNEKGDSWGLGLLEVSGSKFGTEVRG